MTGATGWVKVFRSLKQWEWYTNSHMVHVLIHLILSANHEGKEWRGVLVERGQLVAGLHSLSAATGISVQTLRTTLKRLEKTGEINRRSNNHFSIITVCNYEFYQNNDSDSNKQTNNQATSNQQATNNKQEVKNKEDLYMFNFDQFWNQYPRKQGKREALKKWKKLKPDDQLQKTIIEAVSAQTLSDQWQKDSGQYVPMPATWLNGRRWEDELQPDSKHETQSLQLVEGRRVF